MPYRTSSFQKPFDVYYDKPITYVEIVYLVAASLMIGSTMGLLAVTPIKAPPTVCQEHTSCFDKISNS